MASDTPVSGDAGRRPDRLGAALAAGFIVLLLATELVLALPDVADSASSVANFVALSCLIRLVLEAGGQRRGALESIGPLSFIVLVAVTAVLSLRGILSSA